MDKHKCFISFKTQDISYKEKIQNSLNVDMIDKSLNEAINSEDEEYIMQVIRRDYLNDSTVTIHLIGEYGAENNVYENQNYIKRELQASLYDSEFHSKSGISGVVLSRMYNKIYGGETECYICGDKHSIVNINENTTIKEFSYNYYLPNDKCAWSEDDRYCVLVKWDDFIVRPNYYIDKAFDKRTSLISSKTKVRPK